MDVDGPGTTEEVVAPDLLEQLCTGEHPAGMLAEVFEEFALLVGQFQGTPLDPGDVGLLVDHQLTDREEAALGLTLGRMPRGGEPEPGVHLRRTGGREEDVVETPVPTDGDQTT